jgi:hypothetical protein
MNKLLSFISKAIPPLIVALIVAGMARQSGLADAYVAILIVITIGSVCLLLGRLR